MNNQIKIIHGKDITRIQLIQGNNIVEELTDSSELSQEGEDELINRLEAKLPKGSQYELLGDMIIGKPEVIDVITI